jgi:hypothetical protein
MLRGVVSPSADTFSTRRAGSDSQPLYTGCCITPIPGILRMLSTSGLPSAWTVNSESDQPGGVASQWKSVLGTFPTRRAESDSQPFYAECYIMPADSRTTYTQHFPLFPAASYVISELTVSHIGLKALHLRDFHKGWRAQHLSQPLYAEVRIMSVYCHAMNAQCF